MKRNISAGGSVCGPVSGHPVVTVRFGSGKGAEWLTAELDGFTLPDDYDEICDVLAQNSKHPAVPTIRSMLDTLRGMSAE